MMPEKTTEGICSTCHLPLDEKKRHQVAKENIPPGHAVTHWSCEECGLYAWGLGDFAGDDYRGLKKKTGKKPNIPDI